MKQIRPIHLLVSFYSILFLFTSFVLLYQFVIPHGGFYVPDPTITTTSSTLTSTTTTTSGTGTTISGDTTSTDTTTTTTTSSVLAYPGEVPTILQTADVIGTYETEDVLIHVYHLRAYNSDVYVADVVVRYAENVLAGLAYNTFGGTNVVQTVSEMAEDHDAVFAVNSDYASHYSSGFVIRNGMVLRSTYSGYRSDIILYKDGTVESVLESDTSTSEIMSNDAWQLWSFGPVLIKEGVSVADVNDGIDRDRVNNPRTAFGYIGPYHYLFICVDGRTDVSSGVDIEELASIMMSLGATEAYNLDGGGSSTMYFDGSVINHPSEGTEREVSDCVYIK